MSSDPEGIPTHVLQAFLGGFGGVLRPVQELAFQELQNPRDAVIIAQTGSGKTEAAFVPVAAKLLSLKKNGAVGLKALVISPTRALASDLYRRMSSAFDKLDIRLDVATSDYNSTGKSVPDIVIRTPEGLERVLYKSPESLKRVQEIVIDEIHVYLNSPRGTQLSGQLGRLSSLGVMHRRIGISATVEDPSATERSGLLRTPLLLSSLTENSSNEVTFYDWLGPDDVAAEGLIHFLRRLDIKKVIGFVKRKADAEKFAHLLDRGYLSGKAFPHHANLSSSIRRKVERQMRELPVALVVATSTLEVGVDIGDIDACILFDPPETRTVYLQRIGRAGRRSGRRTVICVSGSRHRRAAYAAAIMSYAKRQNVRPFLSGFLQQLLAMAASETGTTVDNVTSLASLVWGLGDTTTKVVLKRLVEDEFLTNESDSLSLGVRAMPLLLNGQLFRTFTGASGVRLVDESSGIFLGHAAVGGQADILLGGKGRKVLAIHKDSGAAISASTPSGLPSFLPDLPSVFQILEEKYWRYTGASFRNSRRD